MSIFPPLIELVIFATATTHLRPVEDQMVLRCAGGDVGDHHQCVPVFADRVAALVSDRVDGIFDESTPRIDTSPRRQIL